MARLRRCVAFGLLTLASMLPVWGQNYLTGPGTGAESRLDSAPRNVTFPLTVTGAGTYSLAGGIFYMKSGPNTTGNVTLTVRDSAMVPLGSHTLSHSQFCGAATGPACQSYFFHTFTFASPVTLSPGSYTLVLSSDATPQQNTAYFVKGNGTSFSAVAGGGMGIPDLSVTKITATPNLTRAIQAVYAVQIINVGNAPSSGLITVTDTLDPNLTFVSATGLNWSCNAVAQVVTCTTNAVIAAGANAPPITITVNVAVPAGAFVTNAVTVAGGGESNTSNNSAELVSPVDAPDLSVSKTSIPATLTKGQPAVYAIQVSNVGNAASSGLITVTDTLDPSLTFVSVTVLPNWSCSAAAQVVTCSTTAVIPADTFLGLTITVNVTAQTGTSVTNTVTVAGGDDSNPSNNSFQLVSAVNAPDLTVSKTATPTAFTKGQNGVIYTITALNSGNAPSSGPITVTDTLDPNLTFVSATGSNWSCSAAAQVVTCTSSAAILAGVSSSITMTVNVAANAPASVTNNIAIAGGGDTNTSNNSFQLVSAVDAVDLNVSKTANPATFTPGQSGVYAIQVSNAGNAASSGMITVTDTLDPNLTFVSATGSNWSCSAAAQVVTCTTSAAILAGASSSVMITVNVAAKGQTTVTNMVGISGGGDVDPTDNTFILVSNVNTPDLTVSKTATPTAFTKGQNGVIYTITALNSGNAPSSGLITVTDTLDPNLTFVSATGSNWSCSAAAQVVTCTTSAAILAGASAPPITMTVNVAANAGPSVTNGVTVAGSGESNTSNNSFQLVSAVDAVDLTVSKTANPATFTKGQNGVIYTITALNSGNASSSGLITVTDTLGPNLTFVSATGSNWSCSAAAQVVTCTTSAAILAGASAPAITITVNVAANAGPSVTNGVTVAGGGDSNTSGNSFQLVSNVTTTAPPVQGVPATTTPVLILTGMVLIGMVVWLRRRAAYPGQSE